MGQSELLNLTIDEARTLLDRRSISAVELTKTMLNRIEEVEDRIKAFVSIVPEKALEQAKAADARIASGKAPKKK